ncbi:hypothetical protein OAI55_01700 [Nitrosopumilus sp.]|nr:hypothetical protein [Nitrosopumilus sp.]
MKRLIQTQIESDSQKLETATDAKFQNIIYYYWDGKKSVNQKQQVKIDFLGAVSEMEKLDYTFDCNFIGFQNCSTGEYVQLVRLGYDSWYVDVPIKDRNNWEGYLWAGYANTKTITDMLKLFFEEVSWFDSIPWKMRRCTQ